MIQHIKRMTKEERHDLEVDGYRKDKPFLKTIQPDFAIMVQPWKRRNNPLNILNPNTWVTKYDYKLEAISEMNEKETEFWIKHSPTT